MSAGISPFSFFLIILMPPRPHDVGIPWCQLLPTRSFQKTARFLRETLRLFERSTPYLGSGKWSENGHLQLGASLRLQLLICHKTSKVDGSNEAPVVASEPFYTKVEQRRHGGWKGPKMPRQSINWYYRISRITTIREAFSGLAF